MNTKTWKSVFGFSLPLALASSGFAAAFTPGDLVVVQVGAAGGGALGSAATATFLDEYTTSGTLVQQIALPTAASGSSDALTLSGTATSEGFLSLSANGQYLTLGGYNAVPGTASVTTSTASAVNRVVGLVNISLGTVDTTTAINSGTSGNIRSTATVNGTSFYVGSSASGVGYLSTFGSVSAATQVSAAPTNIRIVQTVGGQLYASSSSGAFQTISTVGTGLPTTSGQTTTVLPGMPTAGKSSYDYWFKDSSTVYIADDGSAAAGGGIEKWTLSAGTWSLQYTLLNNGTTTTGVRGLTGFVDGSGNANLFGTTSATATSLIEVTDTGATATANTVAANIANTAFRDAVYIPVVPEPSTMAMVGLGGLVASFFAFRRRKA